MYVARAPIAGRTGGLRVVATRRRTFEGASELALNPSHRADLSVYLADLVRPYGVALREEIADVDRGYSYGEMAEALIRDLVPADEPVDVVVLAFAVPDVRPGRATAVYLSHVCPGSPLAFAICDQGRAAGFTGLRIVREYLRADGCRRGVLVVTEQSTVHYEPPEPVALPAQHAGVALLCTADGATTVRQIPDVAPEQAGARLAAELANLAGEMANLAGEPTSLAAGGTTLVLGAGLRGFAGPFADVRHAPEGQPDTGVWWALADALDAGGGRVVVADYDPLLRYLCLAALER